MRGCVTCDEETTCPSLIYYLGSFLWYLFQASPLYATGSSLSTPIPSPSLTSIPNNLDKPPGINDPSKQSVTLTPTTLQLPPSHLSHTQVASSRNGMKTSQPSLNHEIGHLRQSRVAPAHIHPFVSQVSTPAAPILTPVTQGIIMTGF